MSVGNISILIDPESLRPNPNAGKREFLVQERTEVTFRVNGKGKRVSGEELQALQGLHLCAVMSGETSSAGDYDFLFNLLERERCGEAVKALEGLFPGAAVEVMSHTPTQLLYSIGAEGKYLFRYLDQGVSCKRRGCGWSGEFAQLELDDLGTEHPMYLCPSCGSFYIGYGDVSFENLGGMCRRLDINEEKLKYMASQNEAKLFALPQEEVEKITGASGWRHGSWSRG